MPIITVEERDIPEGMHRARIESNGMLLWEMQSESFSSTLCDMMVRFEELRERHYAIKVNMDNIIMFDIRAGE